MVITSGVSTESTEYRTRKYIICSHCSDIDNLKQRCYEIIGYPEWWDFKKKPRKKIARKVIVISTEGNQSQHTTNIAHSGIIGKASVFCTTSMYSTWIIDTGASDHMTRDAGQLQFVLLSP